MIQGGGCPLCSLLLLGYFLLVAVLFYFVIIQCELRWHDGTVVSTVASQQESSVFGPRLTWGLSVWSSHALLVFPFSLDLHTRNDTSPVPSAKLEILLHS